MSDVSLSGRSISGSITLRQFAQLLPAMGPTVEAAVVRGLRSAAMRGVELIVQEIDNAKPHPAVNLGQLRQSTSFLPTFDGAELFVDAPHAPFIEHGTRPFFPPLAPLMAWAIQKGFAETDAEAKQIAWAVAVKISESGIEPRMFFAKAMNRLFPLIEGEVDHELEALG